MRRWRVQRLMLKRSVRYDGWPVFSALKVKVQSLNCMRHSNDSQWSCLRTAMEENRGWHRWFSRTLARSRWTHWRLKALLYKMEFIKFKCDETSVNATEAGTPSSKHEWLLCCVFLSFLKLIVLACCRSYCCYYYHHWFKFKELTLCTITG